MKVFAAGFLVACALAMSAGLIVGMTSVGPGCPAPVPVDWLGFCSAYDAN